jgi:hypothetical protein
MRLVGVVNKAFGKEMAAPGLRYRPTLAYFRN